MVELVGLLERGEIEMEELEAGMNAANARAREEKKRGRDVSDPKVLALDPLTLNHGHCCLKIGSILTLGTAEVSDSKVLMQARNSRHQTSNAMR